MSVSASSAAIADVTPSHSQIPSESRDSTTSTTVVEDLVTTPVTPAPTPLLLLLPPELIDHLLTQVPPIQRQSTALSLTRVFPDHHISQRHLWTHLVVYRAEQMMPLWKRLKNDQTMSGGVRTFCLQSWRGDADILNNVMRCITTLNTLMLNIGTNFAPDHLEEMFENPRPQLERMELRFRPYVEQASYYQFLAGSYFDTAIETLTRRWPAIPSFTQLSVVQDLPPRSTVPPTAINSTSTSLANSLADLSLARGRDTTSSDSDENSGRSTPPTSISSASDNPNDISSSKAYTGHGPFGNPFLNEKMGITMPKTFAQPIVFFDIHCLAKFGASPAAQNLTHLRLRVPSRDLAKVLITPPRGAQTLFPALRYLDISTTNVRIDTNLSTLLRTYSQLEHLVLDRVNLFGFTARERGPELCHDLGGLLVSAGLARGKERERQIAAWELEERTRVAEVESARIRAQRDAARESGDDAAIDRETAEAIAAMQRAEEQQRDIAIARARRGHRSAAQANFSLRDRPSRRTGPSASVTTSTPLVPLAPADKLYLVLPPLPNLKSIGIGGEAQHISAAKVAEWEGQFHAGWREGLNRLLGWAIHIADKYERARRKADEWRAQELKASGSSSSKGADTASGPSGSTGVKGGHGNGHVSKGKRRGSISNSASSSSSSKPGVVKPPTDVRLFRFPTSSEAKEMDAHERAGPHNLMAGLVEIESSEAEHREYLDAYKQAIGDAQLFADDVIGVNPPCVFCTIPDCEGPARRGAEGERVDGRGGMGGKHRDGCGHLLGRQTWGWEGM